MFVLLGASIAQTSRSCAAFPHHQPKLFQQPISKLSGVATWVTTQRRENSPLKKIHLSRNPFELIQHIRLSCATSARLCRKFVNSDRVLRMYAANPLTFQNGSWDRSATREFIGANRVEPQPNNLPRLLPPPNSEPSVGFVGGVKACDQLCSDRSSSPGG